MLRQIGFLILALSNLTLVATGSTVYVETNDPSPGQNAIVGFRQDHTTGTLSVIGSFKAEGTGQVNLPKVVGPDDSSQEIVATPNGRFLLAVNQGSNTIASFTIRQDGSLDLIGTFESGGVQPDSIGIVGRHVYISNRGNSSVGHAGTVAPNITGFTLGDDGTLVRNEAVNVSFPVDTSPAQNLISRDGRFLFANIFAVPGNQASSQGNSFAPFQIRPDGSLRLALGGNLGVNVNPPLLLGSDTHPTRPLIYAGLVAVSQIATFSFDDRGQLSLVGTSPIHGAAPCWIVVSKDGKYLYSGNSDSDSVGVLSLADPKHPVEIQEFQMRGPLARSKSSAFQIALSSDGHSLFAISQNTDPEGKSPEGNQLHILSVGSNGTLSEPNDPFLFSEIGVPGEAHPQGLAVVRNRSIAR